jgi:ParB-like chromosome segregation protein Spo0J
MPKIEVESVINVSIESIKIGKRIRKSMYEMQLKSLKQDIEKNGLIQPIYVTPASEGNYKLIDGGRRFRHLKNLVRMKSHVL